MSFIFNILASLIAGVLLLLIISLVSKWARWILTGVLGRILRVDVEDRKIGLSLKRAQWGDRDAPEGASGDSLTPPPAKGGMDEHGALGTDKIEL